MIKINCILCVRRKKCDEITKAVWGKASNCPGRLRRLRRAEKNE